MKLPQPAFPLHIENLATIPLLEAQGWEGTDASLDISLFEYDFAWRKLDEPDTDGDDVYFIYALGHGEGYGRCGMNSKTDPKKEWSWAFKDGSLYEFHGVYQSEWDELPFHMKVYDLYQFYGADNIFGTDDDGGFQIEDPSK